MTPRADAPSPCDGCPTAADCPRDAAQVARCAETLRRAGVALILPPPASESRRHREINRELARAGETPGAPSDYERGAPSGAEPRSDLGTAAQAPLRAAGSEATTDPEERVHVYTQRRDAEHCGTSTPRAPGPPPERSAPQGPELPAAPPGAEARPLGGGCCGTVLARVEGVLLDVGGDPPVLTLHREGSRTCEVYGLTRAEAQALAAHLYERVEITVRLAAPEEG